MKVKITKASVFFFRNVWMEENKSVNWMEISWTENFFSSRENPIEALNAQHTWKQRQRQRQHNQFTC